MGIVLEKITNELNETTSVKIRKGATGEVLRRHVESIIPILSNPEFTENSVNSKESDQISSGEVISRVPYKRQAASAANDRIKALLEKDLI